MSFYLDGQLKEIEISEGVYDNVGAIVAEINEQFTNNGIDAEATSSLNKLIIQNKYSGSDHTISGISGSAYIDLMRAYVAKNPPVYEVESYTTEKFSQIIGAKDLPDEITFEENTEFSFDYGPDNFTVSITFEAGSYNSSKILETIQKQIDSTIGNEKITGNRIYGTKLIGDNIFGTKLIGDRVYTAIEEVTIDVSNNVLNFDLGGNSINITLPPGDYTADEIATAINDQSSDIKANYENNVLTILSEKAGNFEFTGGNGSVLLGTLTAEPEKVNIDDLNNELIFQLGVDPPITITLFDGAPPDNYSAEEIVTEINTQLAPKNIIANFENNVLSITNNELGTFEIMAGSGNLLLGDLSDGEPTNPDKVIVYTNKLIGETEYYTNEEV